MNGTEVATKTQSHADISSERLAVDAMERREGERGIEGVVTRDSADNEFGLIRSSYLAPFADGTMPYARHLDLTTKVDIAELVPRGGRIDHFVWKSETHAALVADLHDARLHLAAGRRWVAVEVCAVSMARAVEVLHDVRALAVPYEANEVPVMVWQTDFGSPSPTRHAFDLPEWSAIAPNYPAQVAATLDTLAGLEGIDGAGRLILWHGVPGSGKTTALRALIRAWRSWCTADYIADPEKLFNDPGSLTTVLTSHDDDDDVDADSGPGRWHLVIAEDSDEYLRASARHDAGAALGRLLNLTDGILGQGYNVMVLLTTNEDLSHLHPALTRPGRCLATVEFTAFTSEEASRWLGEPVDAPMTLAELLERRGDISRLGVAPPVAAAIGQYL